MRLKITRALRGSIDGIQLTQFVPGQVYDVSTSFGSYLLAERAAEPVTDSEPKTFVRDRADERPRPPRSRTGK